MSAVFAALASTGPRAWYSRRSDATLAVALPSATRLVSFLLMPLLLHQSASDGCRLFALPLPGSLPDWLVDRLPRSRPRLAVLHSSPLLIVRLHQEPPAR